KADAPGEQLRIASAREAQGVQHEFERQLARGDHAADERLVRGREVAPRLAQLHRAHDPRTLRERELAVRAGAYTRIVAEGPVVEVVAALPPGERVRRHLVLGEPRLPEERGACLEHG